MSFTGVVQNGTVVMEGPCPLPNGTRVEIVVKESACPTNQGKHPPVVQAASPLGERLLRLAGIMEGLPTDLAENHDHYIHGAAKRQP